MKHFTLSILIVLLIVLPLAGCSSDDSTTDITTASDTETGAETTEHPLNSIVGDKKFDGMKFNIGWSIQYDTNECAFELDEIAGDIINESVYERNRLTEERLGIDITATKMCNWTDLLTTIGKLVTSGDESYDVYCCSAWFMLQASLNGYLVNIDEISTLDLSHPWWDKVINEMYTLGSNSQYFISGHINYLDDLACMIIYFNKEICDNIGMEYPYDAVKEGTWTFDKFREMAVSYGSDVDGDGAYTTADTYGFIDDPGVLMRFITAAGLNIIEIDNEGNAYLNDTAKFYEVYEKTYESLLNSAIKTTVIATRDKALGYSETENMFFGGQVLFKTGQVNGIFNMRQTMEPDFGALPSPKYEETQDEYHTTYSSASGSGYAVPVTSIALDDIGIILETMGYYSTDTIYPAVIEKSVLTKSTRDEETAEMLKIIFDSKFYELGQWGTTVYSNMCAMVVNDEMSLASKLESLRDVTAAEFEAVKEYYDFN